MSKDNREKKNATYSGWQGVTLFFIQKAYSICFHALCMFFFFLSHKKGEDIKGGVILWGWGCKFTWLHILFIHAGSLIFFFFFVFFFPPLLLVTNAISTFLLLLKHGIIPTSTDLPKMHLSLH